MRTNLRMQPRNADGYRLLGRVLISQGDCRTGIAQLLKAVELNPAAKDVYVNIAQVLLNLLKRCFLPKLLHFTQPVSVFS